MEEYKHLKKEHFKLFSLFHRWYNDVHADSNRICHTIRNKYKSFSNASNSSAQRKALYNELHKLRKQRTLAWRRYRKRVRFNIFRLVFFKQTRKCPEFCRQLIEQYL